MRKEAAAATAEEHTLGPIDTRVLMSILFWNLYEIRPEFRLRPFDIPFGAAFFSIFQFRVRICTNVNRGMDMFAGA